MEATNNAINSTTNDPTYEQQETATTIANMTNVIPDTGSDIETSPKFEMTTLEKASFDCNDFIVDSSEQNTHHLMQPVNGADETTKPATINIESNPEPKVSDKGYENPASTNIERSQAIVDEPISSAPSEGFVSLHSMANATPETFSVISTNQPVQHDGKTSIRIESGKVEQHSIQQDLDKHQTQATTEHVETNKCAEPDQARQTTEHAVHSGPTHSNGDGFSMMSQSSVDAQMETIIGHALELGGGHQFSQAIGSEDKEKALEHIQKEIFGCKNPMESLAEVASLQATMMSTTTPETNPTSIIDPNQQLDQTTKTETIIEQEPKTDLRTKQNPEDKEVKEESEPTVDDKPEELQAQTIEVTKTEPNTTRNELEASEQDVKTREDAEPSKEDLVPNTTTVMDEDSNRGSNDTISSLEQTIQDEILKSCPKETNSKSKAQTAPMADVVEEQSAIIEETVEVIEEPVEEADVANLIEQPTPIVEEASSGDEAVKQAAGEDKDTDNEVIVEKPEVEVIRRQLVEDTGCADQDMVVKEQEEPVTRRSARKVKPKKEIDEEQPKQVEVKRPVRTNRGRKASVKESDASTPGEVGQGEKPTPLGDIPKEVEQRNIEATSTDETKVDEPVKDDPPKGDESNVEPRPASAESEVKLVGQEPDNQDKELSPEPQISVRSLRTRTPKRKPEVEEKEEPDEKVEIPKKQMKRSRVSDEHNKTIATSSGRSAPTIKLPYKSRSTISSSDPAIRPDTRYEVSYHDGGVNRKFKCDKCKYSTDNLNNIAFHHKMTDSALGFKCPGLLKAAEEQRAEIIRLQQTPKGNKKKSYSRYG